MATQAEALMEEPQLHLVARLWPAVKEKTGITKQQVFDRYREICREFGIEPVKQVGAIINWTRQQHGHKPDLDHGLVVLMVFREALEAAGETVDDPLFPGGGSPGNRTPNLLIVRPLP